MSAVLPALIRRFDLIATAPGGVARLRELILTLAVQGKLVEQDPRDEPADRLIARVHAARSKLVASGQIGKQKPAEPVNEDETAFSLPQGWAWSRVGDLAWPQAGFAFKSTGFNEVGQGLPLIRIRDVGSADEPTTYFSGEFRPEFVVEKGEWLISMDGEFRVRQWHATTALLNQRVTRLVFVANELHAAFIATALQRELTALQGTKAYTTVDHLSGKQIAEAVIALPPAPEQTRIVARVDELMRLCDALEAKGRLEAEQHTHLRGTLLGTLTESSTPEELAANWQRVADHFDLLLDRPEAVDALEQTILQLAVHGLLVPQDSNDEPAAALLGRIRAEKDRMLASGKIKRDKPLPPIAETEVPFDLPTGWTWVTLDSLASQITDGAHHTPNYVQAGVPFLSVKDLSSGVIDFSDTRFITREAHEELAKRCNPESGDLLLTKIGTTGIAVVVDTTLPISLFVSVALIKLPPVSACREFLSLVINSPFVRQQSEDGTEGVGNKNLVLRKIRAFRIPLPPLNEQTRIVARVKELRRVCIDLRAVLDLTSAKQTALADALILQALVA